MSHNNNRRYDRYNTNNRNAYKPNKSSNQNFRPPIRDLTKPPPIIIGQTTERPASFHNKKYDHNPINKNKIHVIPPVNPDPYHKQKYAQNNYNQPTNGGIDRYDINVRDDAEFERPNGKPTIQHQPNLFDTHNRLQPIIIDDFSATDLGNRNKNNLNAKNYNRRIDTNRNYYNDGASIRPINAIDPNDYKFYSFVTESPKPTATRRPIPTTTTRSTYYTPTRSPAVYTTRRTYTYKPSKEYAPTPRPSTIPPSSYNNNYSPQR